MAETTNSTTPSETRLTWFVERPHPDKSGMIQVQAFSEKADAEALLATWANGRMWEHPDRVRERITVEPSDTTETLRARVERLEQFRADPQIVMRLASRATAFRSLIQHCTNPDPCDICQRQEADAQKADAEARAVLAAVTESLQALTTLQEERARETPPDTYTPMLWVSMNEDQRYEEYIRVRQRLVQAEARADAAEARCQELEQKLERRRRDF
jgi:hypothetical protein